MQAVSHLVNNQEFWLVGYKPLMLRNKSVKNNEYKETNC